VLNTEAVAEVNVTALDALESLRQELTARGTVMALTRVKRGLQLELERAGFLGSLGADHVFPTLPTAVAAFHASDP
jgi:SulP family sulfate permease